MLILVPDFDFKINSWKNTAVTYPTYLEKLYGIVIKWFEHHFKSVINFLSGPVGNDGHECPMHCPAACNDQHEMSCYGGKDWNGCQNPDFCAPTKRKIVDINKLCQNSIRWSRSW